MIVYTILFQTVSGYVTNTTLTDLISGTFYAFDVIAGEWIREPSLHKSING